MTLDFQKELLRYLVSVREAKRYIAVLEPAIFDLPEHQLAMETLQKYVKKYKTTPAKANLLEYFDRELKNSTQKIAKEVKLMVDKAIREMFDPFDANPAQFRETAINYAQFKKTKQLFNEYGGKLKDGGFEVFSQIHKGITDIVKLQDEEVDDENKHGGFLLRDHKQHKNKKRDAAPTFLKALNKMTAAGGFYSPQLIVFLSGPKSFKTGTLLNIALEYVRDGFKVYYADGENGNNSIRNRMRQAMLKCTYEELVSGVHQDTLNEMVQRMQSMGGDFVHDFFPAYKATTADVEAELQFLKDEYGWVPDIIFWDYADLFKCTDPKVTEKRLVIQRVYHEIIAINNRWGTFSFTPSQVSQKAVGKAVINMKDFAEDFGKAANCHAAFAICRTEDEVLEGLARIIPVVQREGVQFKGKNICTVRVDEERMDVEEVDLEAETKKLRKKIKASNLKDE